MRRATATVLATVLIPAALPALSPVPQALAAPGCPASIAPADTSTAGGWVGYLAQHRDSISVSLDDGRGGTLAHRADAPMPTASMVKLVHLAAFAEQVAAGRIDEHEQIPIAEWQKWYVAYQGTPLDGGAHIEALKYLKIPATNGVPNNLARTVSLRQLADVMIRFSDSAAPDALRERLGDGALTAVMQRYGLPGPVPSFKGLYGGMLRDAEAGVGPHESAARSYAGTARSFARLVGDLASGRFGSGSAVARPLLETGPAPEGFEGFGFKGGSLPGILTEAFEARRDDGTVTVGVLMVRNLSDSDARRDVQAQMPHQAMLLHAMTNATKRAELACALSR